MAGDIPRESGFDPDTMGSGEGFGEPLAPRRSTWSPPASPADDDLVETSDDELARALEEDFERATHTGAFPVVDPAVDPVDDDAVVDSHGAPVPGPPVRRSIPTAELAAMLAQQAASGEGAADVMAQLEDQLRLQEQDASEFLRWQETMVAKGDPAALADVAAARANFGDIVDAPPQPQPQSQPAPPASEAGADHAPAAHRFRVDEVLDSDLLSAPAPMTAPVADIPPPSDHVFAAPSAAAAMQAPPPPPADPTPLAPAPPELIEPAAPALGDVFDFDALIGGEARVAEAAPTAFILDEPTQPGTGAPSSTPPAPTPPAPTGNAFLDEDVADNDQVLADLLGPFPVTSEGVAIVPAPPSAPFEPVASATVGSANVGSATAGPPTDGTAPAVAPASPKPSGPAVFRVEESSTEPTPADQRIGRAARLFWLWFAANSSVVSLAIGGVILSLGMSLRQAIVATLIGVAVSFLPLGLGTLAGKWSGQPTMIVSRATFGHLGNILPAVLALVVRLFWGAVLLWFLGAGTARILVGAELTGPLTETQVMVIALAIGFLLALVIAFFGYGLIARVYLVFTIISAILIVGLILITWPAIDITMALTVLDGPWVLLITGAVLVFSFVGLAWAVSSADLARYQRSSGSRAGSMLWSTFGATIPAFVLITYGAFLAASNPEVATGLLETPLDTIALLIPVWYPVPLIAALVLSLLSGVVLSIYSGGFALQATGASMRRSAAVVIVGAGVAGLAVLLAFSLNDYALILRDVATTLAVPVAAWAGIFGAEMMIRNRAFSTRGLHERGGVYADFHWLNLAMLVVASAVGFGLTTGSAAWLSWQGYLFGALGVPLSSDLAGSDLGVFVALALGILTPIAGGIRMIRKQEAGSQERPPAVTH